MIPRTLIHLSMVALTFMLHFLFSGMHFVFAYRITDLKRTLPPPSTTDRHKAYASHVEEELRTYVYICRVRYTNLPLYFNETATPMYSEI